MKKVINEILNNKYNKVTYKNNIFYLEKKLNFLGTKKYKQELQEFEIKQYVEIYCKNKNITDKIDFNSDIVDILKQIEKGL